MTNTQPQAGPIPDHVPAELVDKNFAIRGGSTTENPFHRIIPEACEGPDIIYVPNMVLGGYAHAWVLRRYKDIETVYKDTEHFSSKDFANLGKLVGETWSLVPGEQDAPEHTMYRQFLTPLFAAPKMAKLEGKIEDFAEQCIAHLRDKKQCEFIADFSFPFPVGVTLDVMGLPKSRMEDFGGWINEIILSRDMEGIAAGVSKTTTYLREVLEECKKNPGDDLFSLAVTTELDGRKLTDDELIGFAMNFFIGGLDTVSANLSNFVRYLAENPEDQQYLRENPDKIRLAMEEFFRAFAVATTYRRCIKEITLNGVLFKPGDYIAMITTLAGRDGEMYENPHDVVLDRNPRHLTFATGAHHCLGVHLARREVHIALKKVLETLPPFRLQPGVEINSSPGIIVQPRNLPLEWD